MTNTTPKNISTTTRKTDMTDELKFYDPETGAELHRVPEGATILKGTPFGHIRDGRYQWRSQGSYCDWLQKDDIPRFTREPIAPPLPSEPGYYLDKEGDLWRLNGIKQWKSLVSLYNLTPRDAESFAPFSPATIVPTETWDRLRVLDPDDKQDRVDRDGWVWRYSKEHDGWESENGVLLYTLEAIDRYCGPLRFADEVSDDE